MPKTKTSRVLKVTELPDSIPDNAKTAIRNADVHTAGYAINQSHGENFSAYHGDCCAVIKHIPDNSIGYSIFSPPFASLYVYSASDRDMGNSKSYEEFFEHFDFLVKELFRVIQPGRLCSFHCMNIPTSKTHHGYIGIQDFRGDLIRAFQKHNWIYHSEACIWKDPVTAMQRTKAIGLLHKQIVKDSCMSRQGIPDYLVTMRKPGVNINPVVGEFDCWYGDAELSPKLGEIPMEITRYNEETGESYVIKYSGIDPKTRYSIDVWQQYASPVWMDINPSDTLQFRSAREHSDERHICPLQLQVIERGLEMWSNPGDTVLSPFMGIGSEGYVSIEHGRKFIGIELKESYYKQSAGNLQIAENKLKEQRLL